MTHFDLQQRKKKNVTRFFCILLCVCLIELSFFQIVQADDGGTSTFTPTASPQNAVQPTQSINSPAPTITPTPLLKLTFSEAASHPVSGWRPSLFPIPFALSPHDHFYLARPIAVTTVNWPLADYRYGYIDSETDTAHTGVDIDAQLHTPILAAGDGKVVFTGYGLALGGGNVKDPYGLAVMIRHDFSYQGQTIMTVYAHMEKINVKVGDRVSVGDTIGYVGLTGNTSGPHVHFEVRLETNNAYSVQNPELWMVPPTDDGVLVGQFIDNYGDFMSNKKVTVESKSDGDKWTVYTYANPIMKNDPYYNENLVLSDLPAGEYTITFLNDYKYKTFDVTISPGAITYFRYKTTSGFSLVDQSVTDTSFLIPYTN